MKLIIETFKNTGALHHAYCIEGDKESILKQLNDFFRKHLDFPTEGNPDYWQGEYDTLGIDHGRMIKEVHATRPFGEHGKKIYVIMTNNITHEAQNALLKIFEEPQQGHHFFIVMPSAESLLPTLKSRLQIVRDEDKKNEAEVEFAELFLDSALPERLNMTKEITDAIKDETKTKAFAISFLGTLERVMKKRRGPISVNDVSVFNEILKAKGYLEDRSSSVKTILEHIALVVPR
jgi:hypothetical protein